MNPENPRPGDAFFNALEPANPNDPNVLNDPNRLRTPEGLPTAYRDRGLYPVFGARVIEQLNAVEIGEQGDVGELKRVVRRGLALCDGLFQGPESKISYDMEASPEHGGEKGLKDRITALQNKFLTIEDSIERGQDANLRAAIYNAIDVRVEDAALYSDDREQWNKDVVRDAKRLEESLNMQIHPSATDEEKLRLKEQNRTSAKGYVLRRVREAQGNLKAVPELLNLREHVRARFVIDGAFQQRQLTCQVEEKAAKLGDQFRVVVEPDSGHWKALFQNDPEFGVKVNSALRFIDSGGKVVVKDRMNGQPERDASGNVKTVNAYAESGGFNNTVNFHTWMKDLLAASGGSMDAAWLAWRVALVWEIPAKYGWQKDKDGEYSFGTPPIVNSLLSWTISTRERRRDEFGWKVESNDRTKHGKWVNKSGYPLSIDHVNSLCLAYLDESKIRGFARKDGKPADATLYDIWKGNRSLGLNPTDFSHDSFPWIQTESGGTQGEPGLGTMGLWNLNRGRAFDVLTSLRDRPEMNKLNAEYFEKIVRTWDKRKIGTGTDPNVPPEKNPRAIWLAGIIEFHHGGSNQTQIDREFPDMAYRSISRSDALHEARAESTEARGMTVGAVLMYALNCQFIRQSDAEFIKQLTNIQTN